MGENKPVYQKYFTPGKWENVNVYNKRLRDDFLMEIKSKGLKTSTQEQYANDIRIICCYILDELGNKSFCDLKKKDFRNMVLYFKERNLSNARTNRLMSSVRSMLNFAEDDEDWEEISFNYASKVKGLSKEEVREIIFLRDDEIMYIYNTLIEKQRYQHALLCALLYESLARRTEMSQLRYDDISLDRAMCTTMVIAKRGKKYRPVYNDLTKRAFVLYSKQRGVDEVASLWKLATGEGADSNNLYDWVVSWRDILEQYEGEYKLFNPHSFRHSGATNYENGTHQFCKKIDRALTLTEIQKIMNHTDISTTQSYIKNRDEEVLDSLFNI